MAERFGFYDRCLFHTTVEETVWDDAARRWIVKTDRRRRHARALRRAGQRHPDDPAPRHDRGHGDFQGRGIPHLALELQRRLEDKRVGIIGTGATAVQVVPEIAKVVKALYVFQRTPSTIDVRDQRATTPGGIRGLVARAGTGRSRPARAPGSRSPPGRTALQGNDDFLSGKVENFKRAKQHDRELSPEEMIQAQLNSNFRIMEQIRGRVDSVVKRPEGGGGVEALLSLWLQAADLPRRIPAVLQPARTSIWSTRRPRA